MRADYRLQTLLELRAHALAEAEQTLAQVASRLARVQAAQRALDDSAERLLRKVANLPRPESAKYKAAQLQARSHYEARLREDLAQAQILAQVHRTATLAPVERSMSEAQAAHLQAKQDLKLVNRHREAAQTEAQRQDERRREDEVDTWLRARQS